MCHIGNVHLIMSHFGEGKREIKSQHKESQLVTGKVAKEAGQKRAIGLRVPVQGGMFMHTNMPKEGCFPTT